MLLQTPRVLGCHTDRSCQTCASTSVSHLPVCNLVQPAGCVLLNGTNVGENYKLTPTSFRGTALLLTPEGSKYTITPTAQDCCASCVIATDIELLDNTTVADNNTVDTLEEKQWFQGCNLFNWCALKKVAEYLFK